MDLPSCPACGQSVLDDDVDDCPFCGESLSGTPSAKPKSSPEPAAEKPAAPTGGQPAAASGGKRAARPATSTATATKAQPGEDDPFALERATARRGKVIRLRPQPESGRRHEVVCPMCETVGYTARKAAGMDVRCANPDCQFPDFTAPALPDEDETDADKDAEQDTSLQRFLTPVNIGVGAGVILLCAVIYFVFIKKKPPSTIPGNRVVTGDGGGGDPSTPTKSDSVKTKKQVPKKSRRQLLVEARGAALSRLRGDADSGGLPPIAKAIARECSTDGFALAGRLQQAEAALAQLKTVTAGIGGEYYQVRPLTTLAAAYRNKGDATNAAKHLADARAIVDGLPEDVGRPRFDAVVCVAAELAATGKATEARTVLSKLDASDLLALESLLLTRIRTIERDNAAAAMANRPAARPRLPKSVAVTLLLATRGLWDEALSWAKSQPANAQFDCLLAWAEARVVFTPKMEQGGLEEILAPVIKPLPAIERGILHARLAVRYHAAGNQSAAQAQRTAARAIVTKTTMPAAAKTMTIKDVSSYEPPATNAWSKAETLAAAWFELAHAEFLLDAKEDAAKSLASAQDVLRSLTISPNLATKLADANDNQVGAAFGLTNAAAIARQFREHRNGGGKLTVAAKRRFAMQTRLLSIAMDWDNPASTAAVWNIVQAGSKLESPEPWYASTIPTRILIFADRKKDDALKKAVSAANDAHRKERGVNVKRRYWLEVEANLLASNFRRAAAQFRNKRDVDDMWRRLYALSVASRLFNEDRFDDAYEFCRGLQDDTALQMQAFIFFAARTVQKLGPLAAWPRLREKSYSSQESAAVSYGYARSVDVPKVKKKKKAKKEAGKE